LLYRFKV